MLYKETSIELYKSIGKRIAKFRKEQKMSQEQLAQKMGVKQRGTIGFNRSFLTYSYYPLYSNFFSELGYEIVLPREPSQEGIDQRNAPFCYPAELAHGFFYSLI